ncbi:hypothetical protein PENTCL1PPCAC_18280, partial [Pristionchus entomophagus]
DGGKDDEDQLNVDMSRDYGRHPPRSTKMKTKRSEDNQRGLNTQVWKRVGADKVTYPVEEYIEEPKIEPMRKTKIEKKPRDGIVPRLNEIKCEMNEKPKVEKREIKQPKHRLASPLRNGSLVSTSSCDSLSSILGHSLTMSSTSGVTPNFTGITSTSPTDSPSPSPSSISLDPFGREKKCNCAYKPTSNIAQALSIDTPLTTSTVDQSIKTTTKPLTISRHSFISQSSNDIPSFTQLCGSEYDSDDELSPPKGPPLVSRRTSTPYQSCTDGSRVDDASWYTVDAPTNRSMEKRGSRRKRPRKMKIKRPGVDIRSIRHSHQDDSLDPAKAWAVLIIMAIAVLAYRYSLPMCKRHHHH